MTAPIIIPPTSTPRVPAELVTQDHRSAIDAQDAPPSDDGLDFFRGLAIALPLGAGFWAAIIWIVRGLLD